jgi:pyruvate dehydrogenase E2 component (dihydrolipoamide acetyltransferase)
VTVESVAVPDLGSGAVSGELVAWLVDPGDAVTTETPVATVETGKSATDVPSPAAGTVVERHVEPGETVLVGGPFLSIDVDGDA